MGVRSRAEGQRGAAFVEAVIAMAIIAITITPLITLFMTSGGAMGDSEEYLGGLNVARSYLERWQGLDFDTLAAGRPTEEVDVQGTVYTVTTVVAPRPNENGPNPPTRVQLLDVKVTVTWEARGNIGQRTIALSTSVAKR